MLARAIAQRLVEECGCDEARVTLEYYPGSDAPAHGEAIVDGRHVVLDCRALTGDVVVPKLQAIFTPAKSSGREFDLKEAARWAHHAYLGELWRELPGFVLPSSAIRSGKRRSVRPREDLVGHLADQSFCLAEVAFSSTGGGMDKIVELEQRVQALSDDELAAFRRWSAEFDGELGIVSSSPTPRLVS